MERALWIIGLVIFWVAMIGLMYWGWRGRAKRQSDRIGDLPPVPKELGEQTVAPVTGLYVGSTIAPSWQDRIAVGDLGFRAAGEIARYTAGILLERDGANPIWIPEASIRAARTERGLAGKVMTKDGLLVVRWELPTGTEVDTGFRADDKSVYPNWIRGTDTGTDSEDSSNSAGSGQAEQNGESA
ncbi:transporter [Rhodococcus sp. NPDC058521]|uniref:PH-like domain-containing protein n=1 Tax=Rhodococcus sp. NPDC058521 TaxID=3346536 RepID=UPI0036615AAD